MSPDILLFPGQGSQYVGMGADLFENYPESQSLYESASKILGVDIADISFNGPDDLLRQTQHTQPAIFIHSICTFNVLKEKGMTFKGVAGHSLGEFSSLVAAEVLTFEDALLLVKVRSSEMAKAGKIMPGTMAAIIGASDDQLNLICKQKGIVVIANLNAPGQVVISGDIDAVKEAIETAKSIGVRRALPLNVSGAFHSPLMKPARDELSKIINKLNFKSPIVPIYQNVTSLPVNDPDSIKSNILNQLESPVRWVDTIQNMIKKGHSSFIELGPGKVLQGLQKRISADSNIISLGKFEELQNYEI